MFGGVLQPDVAADARAPPGGVATAVQSAAAASPVALTHVDSEGKLRMVDVGIKPHTRVRVGAACATCACLTRCCSAPRQRPPACSWGEKLSNKLLRTG